MIEQYTEAYWNYRCDLQWIISNWNTPERIIISLFTRHTNWPGDPYAMVHRHKEQVVLSGT